MLSCYPNCTYYSSQFQLSSERQHATFAKLMLTTLKLMLNGHKSPEYLKRKKRMIPQESNNPKTKTQWYQIKQCTRSKCIVTIIKASYLRVNFSTTCSRYSKDLLFFYFLFFFTFPPDCITSRNKTVIINNGEKKIP